MRGRGKLGRRRGTEKLVGEMREKLEKTREKLERLRHDGEGEVLEDEGQ